MTIKDLAKLSGYSLGTVSRVLNNQPNVSEQARKTILALVEQHGFERNTSAQLLKQQQSKSVLIVVKGTSNEMFAAMVSSVAVVSVDAGSSVLVSVVDLLAQAHRSMESASSSEMTEISFFFICEISLSLHVVWMNGVC